MLHLDLVVVVLGFVVRHLLTRLTLCLVERDVQVLDLLRQLLLVQLPLGFVLLVTSRQFLDLVLLDFHGCVLVFFLGGKVELLVLGVSTLFLKL